MLVKTLFHTTEILFFRIYLFILFFRQSILYNIDSVTDYFRRDRTLVAINSNERNNIFSIALIKYCVEAPFCRKSHLLKHFVLWIFLIQLLWASYFYCALYSTCYTNEFFFCAGKLNVQYWYVEHR